MIIIIIIILLQIISMYGFYNLINLLLAISTFILSTLQLITNRNNFISRLIQLISLAFIIHIIVTNVIDLGDDSTILSFSSIIYFKDFKYRKRCFVYNERTKILDWFDLIDIKNSFLNNLNNNQYYLIKLKYQFLLKSKEIFRSSMDQPVIITNQLNSKELIYFIEDEINFLFLIERLNHYSPSSWKDDLKIEIVYYKLDVIK